MPRGRKSYTLEEKIENTEKHIHELEDELKAERNNLKSLLSHKKELELSEVNDLIKATGKSIEEIKEILSNSN